MNTPQDSSLGREVSYPSQYDPGLLFPIPRVGARAEIGLDEAALPFVGHDRWHAFELGWLDRAWQTAGRRRHGAGAVHLAQSDRIEVVQAVPQLAQQHPLR